MNGFAAADRRLFRTVLSLTVLAASGVRPPPLSAQPGPVLAEGNHAWASPSPVRPAASAVRHVPAVIPAPASQAQEDSGAIGTSRTKAAAIGGVVGFIVGGVVVWDVLEVDTGADDLSDDTWRLVDDATFWKAVGVGAVVVGAAGAIIGATAFGPYGDAAQHRVGPLEFRPWIGPNRVGGLMRVRFR